MNPVRVVLLAAVACLCLSSTGVSAALAGHVLIAVGQAELVRGGAATPLRRGRELQSGDTVRLGPRSNAQLRMTDGALVALRPSTVFRIDEYRFEGEEDSVSKSFFSLLKGGIRTLTGLIGKSRQDAYQLSTPTSTIGIRGTGFGVLTCQGDCFEDDGTPAPDGDYGAVVDGDIGVAPKPPPGSDAPAPPPKVFGRDQFFHADAGGADQLIAPPSFLRDMLEGAGEGEPGTAQGEGGGQSGEQQTTASEGNESEGDGSGLTADGRAASGSGAGAPGQETQTDFRATENRDASGAPAVVGGVTATDGIVVAYGFPAAGQEVAESQAVAASALTFDAGTGLIGYQFTNPDDGAFAGALAPGSLVDQGFLSDINGRYGRWMTGTVVANGGGPTGVPPTGVHFAHAPLAPRELILARTGTFTFSDDGGTLPTDSAGNVGFMSSISMNVNFTTRTAQLNAGWTINSVNYALTNTPLTFDVSSPSAVGLEFDGANHASTFCTVCNGGSPGPVDFVSVSGGFVGAARGDHAGLAISTSDAEPSLGVAKSTSSARFLFCPAC